jgi:hypothetical protein
MGYLRKHPASRSTWIQRLTLARERNKPITAMTTVRWARDPMLADAPPGLGLAFLRLGNEVQERINGFVRCREPLLYEA